MRKSIYAFLLLLAALLAATVCFAADEAETGYSLDWQSIISGGLVVVVAVLSYLRKKDKKTWADTALRLAETAQDIVESITSKNDTEAELAAKGTAAKVASVQNKVANGTTV